MEDIHRTHKEPAWGWIGALLDARKAVAPAATKPVTAPAPRLRARRVAC